MKPRFPRSLFFFLLLGASFPAPLAAQGGGSRDSEEAYIRSVTVTRWADPTTRPETYEEWRRAMAASGKSLDGPFQAKQIYRSPASLYKRFPRFDILQAEYLAWYTGVNTRIYEYIADLEKEGWAVTLWRCSGGTPPGMRTFLKNRYARDHIKGAILLGDLPVAWYEIKGTKKDEFPCDLFYMDMDGTWVDSDKNGKYDAHTSSQQPEIFIGRLTPSPLAGSWGTEAALLENYLRKAHLYRTGGMSVPDRALAFQDDDWFTMNTGQQQAFQNVVKVTDKVTTNAANYRKRLKQGFKSVVVCAHSNPYLHSFKVPGSSGTIFRNTDLWALDPPCLFYNCFACSNCRYTSKRYMGGAYIFEKTRGLIAVGSTKTGSMLYFDDYYAALGRKECFGRAFQEWFAKRHPYSSTDIFWFYGMTLLGDPTLWIEYKGAALTYGKGCAGTGSPLAVSTVAPSAYSARFGEGDSLMPLGYYDHRVQQIVAAGALPPAFTAKGIAFRFDEKNAQGIPGLWVELSLDLGYTTRSPAAPGTVFAGAFSGPPVTVLAKQRVSLPLPAGPNTSPQNWEIRIPFQKPFSYKAAPGKNLLMDFRRTASSSGKSLSPFRVDAVKGRPDLTGVLFAAGPGASAGMAFPGYGAAAAFLDTSSVRSVPLLTPVGLPAIGRPFQVRFGLTRPRSPAGLLLGFSRTLWSGLTLPLDLTGLGAPGCTLLASPDLVIFTSTDWLGTGRMDLSLPRDPVLVRNRLFLQGMVLDPPANPAGLAWTPGLEITVGGKL